MPVQRMCLPLLAALLVIASGHALAARVVVDGADEQCFSLDVPAGWLVASPLPLAADDDPTLPRIVSMFPTPEAQVWLGLWHARPVSTLDEAKERFADLEGFVFEDPVVTESGDRQLAGFPAYRELGTAVSDGEPVTFGIVTFAYAPGAIGVGIYLGEDDEWGTYADTVAATLETIRAEAPACGSS